MIRLLKRLVQKFQVVAVACQPERVLELEAIVLVSVALKSHLFHAIQLGQALGGVVCRQLELLRAILWLVEVLGLLRLCVDLCITVRVVAVVGWLVAFLLNLLIF